MKCVLAYYSQPTRRLSAALCKDTSWTSIYPTVLVQSYNSINNIKLKLGGLHNVLHRGCHSTKSGPDSAYSCVYTIVSEVKGAML